MKNLFSLLLVVIIGIGTVTFSQTVTIGTQEWMTKNLDVSTFKNGDPIPEAKTDEAWKRAGEGGKPAWCYYNNDPKNGIKYGKLYNWYAVNDARGLAPNGYHVPTNEEWTILDDYLGVNDFARKRFEYTGTKMKSTSGWESYGCKSCDGGSAEFKKTCTACKGTQSNSTMPFSGNGSNISGFTGLPGGYRHVDGSFYFQGIYGYWWSASEYSTVNADLRFLDRYNDYLYSYGNNKAEGYSVRCISGDQPIEDTTMMEFSPPIITDAETDFLIPIPEQIEDTTMTAFSLPPHFTDEEFETFGIPDIIETPTDDGLESPVTFVEEEADFPGGTEAMFNFINEYIDYPREAIDSAIRGRVIVRFVVEKDGRISNVTVLGPLAGCKACDRAAVKVVQKNLKRINFQMLKKN
ncbi:MAG: TonB family protein [Chitinophagia bacterium]|nr:TonB family protein [Chitinophagia bacterium]